jgi:hypothetical protein
MALIKCVECGNMLSDKALNCPKCGNPVKREPQIICPECNNSVSNLATICPYCGYGLKQPAYKVETPQMPYSVANDEVLIQRIAKYERMSCIFWLILGIIQIIFVVSIVAGIWNIVAVISDWKLPDKIRRRDASIPETYENNLAGLIIIGVVNLIFGGVIGVAFVVFDFYIRKQVITNAHLFSVVENEAKA